MEERHLKERPMTEQTPVDQTDWRWLEDAGLEPPQFATT